MNNDMTSFLGFPLEKLIIASQEFPSNELTVAGKNIKKILKFLYPELPVKVSTMRYSGGNSLNIAWPDYKNLGLSEKDTPTQEIIKTIETAFSAGQFNGYEDSYDSCKTHMHIYGKAKCIFMESSDSLFSAQKIIEHEKKILEKSLKKTHIEINKQHSTRL